MPLDERQKRHKNLFNALLRNDISLWGDRFLANLNGEPLPGAGGRMPPLHLAEPIQAAAVI